MLAQAPRSRMTRPGPARTSVRAIDGSELRASATSTAARRRSRRTPRAGASLRRASAKALRVSARLEREREIQCRARICRYAAAREWLGNRCTKVRMWFSAAFVWPRAR